MSKRTDQLAEGSSIRRLDRRAAVTPVQNLEVPWIWNGVTPPNYRRWKKGQPTVSTLAWTLQLEVKEAVVGAGPTSECWVRSGPRNRSQAVGERYAINRRTFMMNG
jgi:hypothetical protein